MLKLNLDTFQEIETSAPNASAPVKQPPVSHADSSLNTVTNAKFISAIFHQLPEDASIAVCSKLGDPTQGGWSAVATTPDSLDLNSNQNNYVNCSSFSNNIDFNVKKENFKGLHCLLLDDIGTKVNSDQLKGFELSALIETSPGNYQGLIILEHPITDVDEAANLQKSLIAANLCDPGASGLSRWARLPMGINGKDKYKDENGQVFNCKLVEWRPEKRYTPEQIKVALKLPVTTSTTAKAVKGSQSAISAQPYAVYTPKPIENPVITALKARGLYKEPLSDGKHDITCPWLENHTDQIDGGTAYFEPSSDFPLGGFCCQHSHKDNYHIGDVLDCLDVEPSDARHKPIIRSQRGELHRIVEAAGRELASEAKLYQWGGLIADIIVDPISNDPSITVVSQPALTKKLSAIIDWEKFDSRSKCWTPTDPSTRIVNLIGDAQNFNYLPVLKGIARQPYFRVQDGKLMTEPSYDTTSKIVGVFDSQAFVIDEPTMENARLALDMIADDLLSEVHFVSDVDKAAALSAIFTAVVRPTLDYAPGFHVRAPMYGGGKSYLCSIIGQFAGPGENAKVAYPTTSEEATKVILALLLCNPAVIEFDDMDTDWKPHTVIKQIFTAETITDRILGQSKTATVSTKSLLLGSGNNVGPERDLLRRIVTIHLDPRNETPATMRYQGSPIDLLRQNREKYVSAVLTIVMAWREAGCPRENIPNIVTYDKAWSDYCRHPLIWLGLPDPATSLIEQVTNDPDGEAIGRVMLEWHALFGSKATTVRKVIESTEHGNAELKDALFELPVVERGNISPNKLGWFLRRNANRIIDGFEFQKSRADGRLAWCLVQVTPQETVNAVVTPEKQEFFEI